MIMDFTLRESRKSKDFEGVTPTQGVCFETLLMKSIGSSPIASRKVCVAQLVER